MADKRKFYLCQATSGLQHNMKSRQFGLAGLEFRIQGGEYAQACNQNFPADSCQLQA
ncbi:MAG: hypothetical protein Q7V00_09630 [Sulfurimicrobium sp.]|jgi:hypothetical protein|nr:hypothetical protein [Sulfurimicrobium sp.]MDP1705811.1 hypothetical protein [Sulfurimicrobium sp.]MDP2198470.1 hypothetical protein [Sulfurimicrobium sp.]MDP3687376.1 hypothetical protein [Sulfurimicrobium sp.]MDZ7657584.1 hypothetical protein [Sulfurimicrobium sp.]